MGNKSRFRMTFDAAGNQIKNVPWKDARDMAKAHQPKTERDWMGLAPIANVDRSAYKVGPARQFHIRQALPMLWNSSKAGTFRRVG